MTVSVDGVERYHWPVSTGNPSHETPNGNFRTFRMEADHFSKEFDDAPMPHSIFFTKIGHAIHGTFLRAVSACPASHGCVRISRTNASTLYALVQKEGVLNTTVTLTGSSRVALARNPRSKRSTEVARGDPAPNYRSYDAAGNPVDLTPGQIAPTQQPPATVRGDDGYIYPADGSSSGQRYPAPRSSRRLYGAQVPSGGSTTTTERLCAAIRTAGLRAAALSATRPVHGYERLTAAGFTHRGAAARPRRRCWNSRRSRPAGSSVGLVSSH